MMHVILVILNGSTWEGDIIRKIFFAVFSWTLGTTVRHVESFLFGGADVQEPEPSFFLNH